MAKPSLKERVEQLESKVDALQNELRAANGDGSKDWRRTIGVFTGDEGMQQIFKDAMRLRELDRKKARTRAAAKSKTRR